MNEVIAGTRPILAEAVEKFRREVAAALAAPKPPGGWPVRIFRWQKLDDGGLVRVYFDREPQ